MTETILLVIQMITNGAFDTNAQMHHAFRQHLREMQICLMTNIRARGILCKDQQHVSMCDLWSYWFLYAPSSIIQ